MQHSHVLSAQLAKERAPWRAALLPSVRSTSLSSRQPLQPQSRRSSSQERGSFASHSNFLQLSPQGSLWGWGDHPCPPPIVFLAAAAQMSVRCQRWPGLSADPASLLLRCSLPRPPESPGWGLVILSGLALGHRLGSHVSCPVFQNVTVVLVCVRVCILDSSQVWRFKSSAFSVQCYMLRDSWQALSRAAGEWFSWTVSVL